MTLATLVTLLRIVLTPVIVWLIVVRNQEWAFALLVAAGLTDALDGWLARWLKQPTALGEKLDPIADKLLLVSVYVALGVAADIPLFVAAVVVGRDVLMAVTIGACKLNGWPVRMTPLPIGKLSTLVQIVYGAFVLAVLAFAWPWPAPRIWLDGAVAVITLASGIAYLLEWVKAFGARRNA